MPDLIMLDGKWRQVATEVELLEFVNKVRKAGGADVIEALFPSIMGEANTCLIARALNFNCSVNGTSMPLRWVEDYPELVSYTNHILKHVNSDHVWCMHVYHGSDWDSQKKAEEIATALELPRIQNELLLPKAIGNAAYAFDSGVAFQEFAVDYLSEDE